MHPVCSSQQMTQRCGVYWRLFLWVKSGCFNSQVPPGNLGRILGDVGKLLLQCCSQDGVIPVRNPARMRETPSWSSSRGDRRDPQRAGGTWVVQGMDTFWGLYPNSCYSTGDFPHMSHPGEPLPSPPWLGVCVDANPWDLVLVQLGKCALDNHQSSFCASPLS